MGIFPKSNRMLPRLSRSLRVPQSISHSSRPAHTRGILHLPIIGAIGGKFLAAMFVKKAVVLHILSRYGTKGTSKILREMNEQAALKLGKQAYPPTMKTGVEAGIDALEASVANLNPTEQADLVWKWVKSLDPVVIKNLVYGNYSVRGVVKLFTGSGKEQAEVREELAKDKSTPVAVRLPAGVKQDGKRGEVAVGSPQQLSLTQMIVDRVPELDDKYTVVLVDKFNLPESAVVTNKPAGVAKPQMETKVASVLVDEVIKRAPEALTKP